MLMKHLTDMQSVHFYMIFHCPTYLPESKTKSKAELELITCLFTMLHHFGDGHKPLEQIVQKNWIVQWLKSLNPGQMPFWKKTVMQKEDIKLKSGSAWGMFLSFVKQALRMLSSQSPWIY